MRHPSLLRAAAASVAAIAIWSLARTRLRARVRRRYRLIYYDGRGQVEIARLIFALGQKLPGRDYDNVRLPLTYLGPRTTDYDCPEFSIHDHVHTTSPPAHDGHLPDRDREATMAAPREIRLEHVVILCVL